MSTDKINDKNKLKPTIYFFGTPAFAVKILEDLLETDSYNILGVITQPDKPQGRGQLNSPPPVKIFAIKHNLKIYQPASLAGIVLNNNQLTGTPNNKELVEAFNDFGPPTAAISVAYGKIIPTAIIDFPQMGIINIHPSLLPRWRGAAPIERALFNGDTTTGVCLMKVDEGLDTGPVFCSTPVNIGYDDTFGTLSTKLAKAASRLLLENLPDILAERLLATPQPATGITYAEKWEKDDFIINWEEPADITIRRIRTCLPEDGARTSLNGLIIKIYSAQLAPLQNFPPAPAGTVVESNKAELIVSCGNGGFLSILEMQFPGKKRLPIAEILRGKNIPRDTRFV